jgi:hypothetical protein
MYSALGKIPPLVSALDLANNGEWMYVMVKKK